MYKAEQDQKHQEDLLHKAKEEWAKKLNPPPKTSGGTCDCGSSLRVAEVYPMLTSFVTVIDDPEDPKFDLEAYLNEKSKETK